MLSYYHIIININVNESLNMLTVQSSTIRNVKLMLCEIVLSLVALSPFYRILGEIPRYL